MKEKTIKAVLTKKFNHWLESIEDIAVRKAVKDNTIITGGCFVSFILNESPNDYDVYFRTKDVALAVARYYCKQFNTEHPNGPKAEARIGKRDNERVKVFIQSHGVAGDINVTGERTGDESDDKAAQRKIEESMNDKPVEDEKPKKKYRPVFLSTNAITLSDSVQLVVRFYGEPSDIHDTYDFEQTKAYWTSWDKKVVIPGSVYEAVANKSLAYTGSKYPLCSLFRIRKFIKRGWNINAGQILKIAFQLSKLDLTDIDVLEDQLIGVDSTYFMNLIEQLRKAKEKDSKFELTQGYLVSIIDKIF